MLSKWWPKLCLIAIIAAAAAIRFVGLKWGLPNSLHSYSYHPDEFLAIGAAAAILSGGLPRFYNYPSLYLYLSAFAILFASSYGLAHSMAALYLAARVATAILGTAAVAVVYWAARQLWSTTGDSSGDVLPLLAAAVLCTAPLHVQHSHFATVDVPSTLFIAACLGFAGLVLSRGSWRDYMLCGAIAGLAAGTKYNAGLVVLALIAAHLLRRREHARGNEQRNPREHPELVEGRSRGWSRLLAGLACAICAFVISTPGIMLQWKEFSYGLRYEAQHAATGHGLVFAGTGNGFIYTFTSSLWYGLGPAFAILFVAAAIYGLVRLDRRALTILAFAVPYYALISLSQVRFARYSLPLFPAAALLIAWMAVDLWNRFSKGIKWAWAALLGLSLAGTLLYSIALDGLFTQEPPQDRAARWIFANVPKGSRIGVFEVPWFYSPPYTRTSGFGSLPQRRQATLASPYQLDILADHDYRIRGSKDDWFVVSDYEAEDALRLAYESSTSLPSADFAQVARINNVLAVIDMTYRLRQRVDDDLSVLGISFGITQSLPHDMRYSAPTIRIYERKK